jgi:hypothetical protein
VDLTVQNILIFFNFSVYKWVCEKFAAGDEGDIGDESDELSQVAVILQTNTSAQLEWQDSGTESYAEEAQ